MGILKELNNKASLMRLCVFMSVIVGLGVIVWGAILFEKKESAIQLCYFAAAFIATVLGLKAWQRNIEGSK